MSAIDWNVERVPGSGSPDGLRWRVSAASSPSTAAATSAASVVVVVAPLIPS